MAPVYFADPSVRGPYSQVWIKDEDVEIPDDSSERDTLNFTAAEQQEENQVWILYCYQCEKYVSRDERIVHQRNYRLCKTCQQLIYYKCKKCLSAFKTQSGVWQHTKYACGKSPGFKCPHCDFAACRSYNLKRHILRVHKLKG